MELHCLFHRYWHTSVTRDNEKFITGRTDYMDSEREMSTSMTMDVHALRIEEAQLRQYRGPGEIDRDNQNIAGLQGVVAYLDSGPQLREGLQQVKDPIGASLFAETVRGVVQAESYLFKERGYTSPEAYTKYWEGMYTESCRYYGNLDRVRVSWGDYVGYHNREVELFTRFKSQHLYKSGSDSYLVMGGLSDSFHEMSVCLKMDGQNMNVISAEGSLTRVPDSVCRESVDYLQYLSGKNLAGMTKKEIAGLLGKGQGCIHLIDVASDAADTLRLFMRKDS